MAATIGIFGPRTAQSCHRPLGAPSDLDSQADALRLQQFRYFSLGSKMPSPYADAHAKPGGPDDARPTALDIVKDEGLQGKLSGKVVLITGCSSGLGMGLVVPA